MSFGKVVVVTGAAGLIGSAITKCLLESEFYVAAIDNDTKRLKEFSDGLNNPKLFTFSADILDRREMVKTLDFIERKVGLINGAVHSAYPRSERWGAKFGDLDLVHVSEDLTAQLGGAIIFSQLIMNIFLKNGSGKLVHISSIQGSNAPKFEHYEGTNMSSPIEYHAIKAGIINITKYLAKSHGPRGINVNCISPGGILSGQPDEFLKKYRQACGKKGMLDASDVAGTAKFLLSQDAEYVNGQNIIIDDGWSL